MAAFEIENAWIAVEATVRGYLHRRLRGDESTVRNALIDHQRRNRKWVSLTADAVSIHPDDESFDATGLAAFARAQVALLPIHEASAVHLVDLQGVPPAQVAIQLGISLPALEARLAQNKLNPPVRRNFPLRLRQAEEEGRAHIDLGLHPQPPSVTLGNLLARRQTNPGAGIVRSRVETLKQVEDAFGIFGADADAIISY